MPPNRRPPRLAMLLLRGLDHFAFELARDLPVAGVLELRAFTYQGPDTLLQALAWADDAARDAVWFEFCWPPFPELIARTDFAGRRVIVRVHRIEAYETNYAANAPWPAITDAIVVSRDMARILRAAAPAIERGTRIHVIHNGVDCDRFRPTGTPDPKRIGWCGMMAMRKNPTLALEILHRLRAAGEPYALHIASGSQDRVAADAFLLLADRMKLGDAVRLDGAIGQAEMPAWHARNTVLLSTSLHESFGYAIAEAAACGCDIAVLDHLGADEFWPEATRFAACDQAVAIVRAARPGRWRAMVADRFGLPRQIEATRAMLLATA